MLILGYSSRVKLEINVMLTKYILRKHEKRMHKNKIMYTK